MTDFVISPVLPLWLVVALAAMVAVLGLYSLVIGVRGAVLRIALASVILLAMLDISVVHESREPLEDIVLLVVDQSPSQGLGERLEVAEAALETLVRQIESEAGHPVSARVVRSPAALSRDGTTLMRTVRDGMAGLPGNRLAGVVLLTDGQVHDVDVPPGLEAPVHVLLTGKREEIDRRIEIVEAPRYGLVGETVDVRFRVVDSGAETLSARVTLDRPGLDQRVLTVLPGTENTVVVPVDHAGASAVTLAVEPLDGEISTGNNQVALSLNGVRDRLRVLLVSGLPHQGQRTWRNLLKSDAAVDLVHFTILRPPQKNDLTPLTEMSLITFPVRELFEDKLAEFDMVVFDRYFQRDVLPANYFVNVVNYVNRGGAILFATGPDFAGPRSLNHSALQAILPAAPTGRVLEEAFVPRPTDVGRRHPVTAGLLGDDVQAGRWLRIVEALERSGETVLRGADGQPLLVLDRVGQGRVALLLSDQIWLWARGYDGGGPHAALLRNIAHWLMKEPELEEERLSVRSTEDSLVVSHQSLGQQQNTVTVAGPDGDVRTLVFDHAQQGRLSQSLPITTAGLYRIEDGTRSIVAAVGALNPKEWQDPRTSAEPLADILTATGGGAFWLQDRIPDIRRVGIGETRAGPTWMGLQRNGAFEVTGFDQRPLLPGWVLALLGLAGLLWMWWREGRSG